MKIRKTAITALCVVCAIFALSAFASCGLFSPKEAEHEWDGGVVTVAPTCTEEGEELYTCTVCGETRTEKTPALGHVAGSSFSSDEDGHSGVCAVCGETLGSEPHTFDEGSVTTAPACEEPGVRTYVCTVCGWSYTEEVAPLGHNFVAAGTVAPTCTEQGYTVYECTRCGDSYEADYTDPAGHSWDESVVTVAPTCTEEGEALYTCTVCGAAETRTLPAAGHVLGGDYDDDENGHSGVCTVCGETLDSEPHTFDGGVVTKEPTCEEPGETTYTCTVCGYVKTEPIAPLGHEYTETVTDPTCTDDGYTTHTCTRCGDTYIDGWVDALGHDYEWFSDDEDHWQVCTVCGDTTGKVGHSYSVTEETAPTCTTEGHTTYTCECGHERVETKAALGHDYVGTEIKPGCETQGYTEYVCTRCGDTYKDNYVGALGHDWAFGFDDDYHWAVCLNCFVTRNSEEHSYNAEEITEPTCTKTGITVYTCAVCGRTYTEDTPATGHTPVAGSYVTSLGEGYHAYSCARCLSYIIEECTPYLTYEVTTEPTCSTQGCGTYTCGLCGNSFEGSIDKTPHSYVGVVTEPTCSTQGYTTYTCAVCNDTYIGDYTDPTGEHAFVGVVTEPTCTEGGYTTYTCAVCEDTYIGDVTDAYGHEPGDYAYEDETGHWQICVRCNGVITSSYSAHDYEEAAATDTTCTTTTTYTCKECGYSYDEVIEADHSDPEGDEKYLYYFAKNETWGFACTVCGTLLSELDNASGLTLTISTGNIVASGSESEYLGAALESALAYNNVTVVLGMSVTVSSELKVTGSATLDLGGCSLLLDAGLSVSGILTISDSVGTGLITASKESTVETLITNTGTLELSGVTVSFDGDSLTTLISNSGTLSMTDVKLSSAGTSLEALVANGENGSTVTIEGTGTSLSSSCGFAVTTNAGAVTIKDGTFAAGVYVSGGVVTIEGGTFSGTYGAYLADGDLEIKGGTFSGDYPVYAVNGTLTVSAAADIYLDAAESGLINLCVSGTGIRVTLLATVNLGSTLYVEDGADAILDLGRFALRIDSGYADKAVIENHGTLEVYGGNGSNQFGIVNGTADDYLIKNFGIMTLTGITINTSFAGRTLIANGSDDDKSASLLISGGSYASGGAIMENYGTLAIENADLATSGAEGYAIVSYGDAALTGATLTAAAEGILVGESGTLAIEGSDLTVTQDHIIETYGTVTITDSTLGDSNYDDTKSIGKGEDEDHALINMYGGTLAIVGSEVYAYRCAIELFGGDVAITDSLMATQYVSTTNATQSSGNYDNFYYVVYVPAGGSGSLTIEGDVTFKDGICVAYGATLDLTVEDGATLTLDDYYGNVPTDNSESNNVQISDARYLVENYGTMRISGDGAIEMCDYYVTYGAEVLSDADATYLICNYGTMTIDEVTVSTPYVRSALVHNGWSWTGKTESELGPENDDHAGHTGQTMTDDEGNPVYATLTIEGGTFTGGKHVVKSDYDGKLVINGGTFTALDGATSVICSQDILEIKGGSFEGSAMTLAYGSDGKPSKGLVVYDREDYPDETYEMGVTTISGGTFESGNNICVYVTDGSAATVSGGTFSFTGDYGVYLDSGDLTIEGGTFNGGAYPIYAVSGTLTVSADAEIYLASGASLDALTVTDGEVTVTLIGSVKLGTGLLIGEDATVTIDLGAFAMTLAKAYTDDDAVITNYGTAMVYGGRNSNQLGLSGGTASDNMIRNYGEMVLTDVGLKTGVTGRTLIVNGSEEYTGAVLTIKGGKLQAVTTVVENRGTLTIENAEISTTGDEGYAIVSGGDVSTTGGTLTASADGIYITAGTLTLDGGEPVEVEGDDDDEAIIVESALTIEAGDGCYAIYVAGTVEITIENSVSVAGTIYVAEDADLTLIVNGTLTETAKASAVVNAGSAEISGDGEIALTLSSSASLIVNYGDMTIEGVTVFSPYGTVPGRLIENGWTSAEEHDEYFGISSEEPDEDALPGSLVPTEGYATLTITSGTFTGGWIVVYNGCYGILEIDDGTFTAIERSVTATGDNAVIYSFGEASISGGEFRGEEATYAVYAVSYSESEDYDMTITGGVFYGGTVAALYAYGGQVSVSVSDDAEFIGGGTATVYAVYGAVDIYGGTFTASCPTDDGGYSIFSTNKAVVTVYDGYFTGSTKTDENGQIIIKGGNLDIVVTGGDYTIESSKVVYIDYTADNDPINLTIETDEANVVLKGDATLGSAIYVPEETTLNLDLVAYALTLSSTTDDTAVIENHGTLNVCGGYNESWEGSSQIANEDTSSTDALMENYGEATLKGVCIASSTQYGTLIANGSANDNEYASLTIEGSYLEATEGHLVENYGALAMENTTLKDSNYTDSANKQTGEDESHALIDIYAGDVTLTNVELDAYECGIEMFGGSLTIEGGTYATPFEMSTNWDGIHDYFYYVIYVSEGENTITINDEVTFKDGVCVAYGATLDLTVEGTLSLDVYYPDYPNSSRFSDGRYLLENYGTMTITGAGTIEQCDYSEKYSDTGTYTNITEDLAGLKASAVTYLICNYGTMTIEDGITVTTPYTLSALIHNGWAKASDEQGDSHKGSNTDKSLTDGDELVYATLTIEGGTFTGGKHVVKSDYDGYLLINGGTFTALDGASSVICNQDILEINGGSFDGSAMTLLLDYENDKFTGLVIYDRDDAYDATYEMGVTTISGGEFVAGKNICVYVTAGSAVTVSDGTFTFTGDYGVYLDDGDLYVEGGIFNGGTYPVYAVNGTLTISGGVEAYVCATGSDRINLNLSGTGEMTVTLVGGTILGSQIYVDEGQTLNLYLSGYTLTCNDKSASSVIVNYGTLNLDGASASTSNQIVNNATSPDYGIENHGTATLTELRFSSTAEYTALIFNDVEATLSICSGYYRSLSSDYVIENSGTLTIENATMIAREGGTVEAIIVNGSESNADASLTITGGTYTADNGHIVLNYGSLSITDATLKDSNYSDKTYARVSEDESHALIESHSGDVTLTGVDMYAYECGIELYGGALKVDGGLLATTYCDSTLSTDGDHFFYIVYVPEGGDAGMTLSGYVTIKDGIGVAYGGTLDLTIEDEVKFDAYYDTSNGAAYPIAQSRSAVENFGTMKISGSGTLRMVNYAEENEENWDNKSVDFTSTGNDYYFVRNFGTMNISDVTISSPYTESALITNGWQTKSSYESDRHAGKTGSPAGTTGDDEEPVYATMTIDGGSFSGGKHVVKNDYAGKLVINGGTFYAVESVLIGDDYTVANSVICNQDILEITGGTFDSNGISDYVIYARDDDYDATYEMGMTTISGGTFNGGTKATLYVKEGTVTITSGTEGDPSFSGTYGAYLKDGDLDIEGGTFTDCVYPVYAVGGTLTVSSDAEIYLASGASLDALTVTKGEVSIFLLGGATIGSELYVAGDAKVTLDMGTFRLTRSKASGDDGSVVENYGTMIIYGGGTSAQMAISSGTASDNMIRNHGTMCLVSVCLTTSVTGRALIANYSTGSLYIYGCTLLADYAYTNEEGGYVYYDENTYFGDSLVVTDNGDGTVGIDVFTQASLAAAFAYDADEVDVTLESDITLSSGNGGEWKLTVGEDAVIELDLAGYTLSSEEDSSNKEAILVQGTLTIVDTSDDGTGVISGTSRTINVGNEDKAASKESPAEEASDAKLIIESGSIVAENSDTGDAYGIRNVGGTVEINGGTVSASASGTGDVYGVVMFDNGTIVMTGGSIIAVGDTTGEVYGISGNHDYAGVDGITLTISGEAEIYGRDCGIYNPQSGVTTISEYAKVSGGTGIEIKEGHLTVSDNVEIFSDAESFSERTNNNGYDISGAALAISDYELEATDDYLTVTITGGTFSAGGGVLCPLREGGKRE